MPHVTGFDLPFSFYVVFAFLFGLAIGSFLNVVIHRVPRGESVARPGSHCPSCDTAIRAFDNIPLLSFAILRGRCRQCRARIAPVYPLVELLTALVFVALIFKTGPAWEVLLEFVFASVMIALIFIDARHHLLPNVITYPAFVFALAGATARAGWGEQTSFTIDISIIIPGLESEFEPWRAALFGGLLIALAAPGFWLLDKLDSILFGKYFEWEEIDEEAGEEKGEEKDKAMDEAEARREMEKERRHDRAIYATMIIGLIAALAWAAMVVSFSANDQRVYEEAYSGLLRASAGALIGGGLIWWIRAVYFLVRRLEGMGLGDVKMMSVVGAFMGWQGSFGVLLLGSILGSVIGVIAAYRSKRGLKTPLPFGVCLGIAALVVMLTATPFFRWYIGQ
jgi:prepilin signal peptidase PulO-like enzyme (type II secretory pathway)